MQSSLHSDVNAIAIIGFGEVGPILTAAWVAQGRTVSTYDVKLDDPGTRETILVRAQRAGAVTHDTLASALADARLVFSAVTASQAQAVAEAAAEHMRPGQIFIDLNSVSPKVKQHNSASIERSGADYVESAVMAPVPPQGARVPMLLGGRLARQVSEELNGLGMKTEAVADSIGLASAIKLCRSIMIKGMESMCVQSMLAARYFGADARVLTSLAASFPSVGWDTGYEAYLIGRVVEHGQRRSEEMREAAAMLGEIGVDASLAAAIADVQESVARTGVALHSHLSEKGALPDWRESLLPELKAPSLSLPEQA